MSFPEETKGRFRKRAVLANVPLFLFFVPRSVFVSLVRVLVVPSFFFFVPLFRVWGSSP